MNKFTVLKITAVLLVVFTVFIVSAMSASARGFAGQGMYTGGMGKPVIPVGTGVKPYGTGPVTHPIGQIKPYSTGPQQFPGDPINPYAAGQQQIPRVPVRTYTGSGVPAGGNPGIAGYQNTPAGTTGGVIKQTPEKVEAGSENIRRVSGQNPPTATTGGQLTNPSQTVQQPNDASLLRGSNSNDRKGGRYLGQN